MKPLNTFSGIVVKHIACGANHSIALTDDDRVFSWGYNNNNET